MILRLARIAIYVGIALVIAGLIAGFGTMFADLDDLALMLLQLVPIGFVFGFAGLTVLLLKDSRPDIKPPD